MKPMLFPVLIISLALEVCFIRPVSAEPLAEARQAYEKKEYQKALDILDTVIQKQPDNAKAHFLVGLCQTKIEDWDKAILSFKEVVNLDAEHAGAYIQLGFLYEKKKEKEAAAAAWRKVLALAQNEKTRALAQKHLDNLR